SNVPSPARARGRQHAHLHALPREEEMRMRVPATLTSLLVATALTPVFAADMTHERALSASKEPHNWLMYYGNYEGHRFSQLNQINADSVKNLKVAFSVALSGMEGAGTRNKSGNLEATP